MQAAVEQAQANADLGQGDRSADLAARRSGLDEQGAGRHGSLDRGVARCGAGGREGECRSPAGGGKPAGGVDRGSKQITAPFDGVVTARNVDIGDLVNAGGTSGRALFQIADIHRMRIYVNVPQAFLGELAPGVKATLHLPGQKETFEAELVSTSNALAENSRTALVELQADNPDGKLWPGAFAEVHFHIPSDPNTLVVPLTALVFGAQGMRVAAVDANDKVALKPVTLGRNLGNRVEIEAGLSLSDRLIDNPPESTQTGDVVQTASAEANASSLARAEKAGPRKREKRLIDRGLRLQDTCCGCARLRVLSPSMICNRRRRRRAHRASSDARPSTGYARANDGRKTSEKGGFHEVGGGPSAAAPTSVRRRRRRDRRRRRRPRRQSRPKDRPRADATAPAALSPPTPRGSRSPAASGKR